MLLILCKGMIPVYFGSRRNLRDHLVFEEFCGQKVPETLLVLFNKLLIFGGAAVRDPRLLPLSIRNVSAGFVLKQIERINI